MSQGFAQKTNIYSFDVNYIEALLAQGDWAGCWEYLGQVIETLTSTSSNEAYNFGMQLQEDMADEDKKKYVNDFGGLLGELFIYLLSEPAVALTDSSFENLIYYHETLHTLFYICGINNTDNALQIILGDGKKPLSPSQQKKLLVLLSLNTELDIVNILRKVDMKYRVPALVSYFSQRKIFEKNIYENKIKLYELRRDLERSTNAMRSFLRSIAGYFLSSYLNNPDKHLIKENINVGIKNFLNNKVRDLKISANSPRETSHFQLEPNRPTIMVFAELFAKESAMYRCYGDRILALEKEFNVVLVVPADARDPSLGNTFKNYVTSSGLGDIYKIIHDLEPDIIFLPSVGMRMLSAMLAVSRLAPIQIMSLGHPATSMSDNIDYVLGPSDLYDEIAFPKDKYIGDGPARTFLPLLTKEQFFTPSQIPARQGNTIRVAVVGTDLKVSHPFFKLLKEIVNESPFDIHVSFLMAVGGIDSLYIEKFLKENFKNSTYYGFQRYADYIETIKTIDIVLNPFPFGHTNTIIDTLMCGKPCIGMDGAEAASKTEGHVLNAAHLKDKFVAKDEADYKEKFFTLANQILEGNTVFYDRELAYQKIFKHTAEDIDYSKVMRWLYDNHSKLKASDRKYFEMFEEINA